MLSDIKIDQATMGIFFLPSMSIGTMGEKASSKILASQEFAM